MANKRESAHTSKEGSINELDVILNEDYPVPSGIYTMTPNEEQIWKEFVKLRAPDDWRGFDLSMLFRIVKCEAEIIKQYALLEEEGDIIFNDHGSPKMNPRRDIIQKLHTQQLQTARSMSFFTGVVAGAKANERGTRIAGGKGQPPVSQQGSNVASLLAGKR